MGKSLSAKFWSWFLGKQKTDCSNPEAMEKYIQTSYKNQEKPYEIDYKFKSPVKIEQYQNMPIAILNPQKEPKQTVFYIPGGAYFAEPTMMHYSMLDEIAQESMAQIVIFAHPKAPRHHAKESYELLESYYRDFIKDKNTGRIIWAGDSAGGGLALGIAEYLSEGTDLILLSPWLDITMKNPAMKSLIPKDNMLDYHQLVGCGKVWADNISYEDYRVSPINGDVSGLGKILLFAGTNELFHPDICQFKEKLDAYEISCQLIFGEEMEHIWPLLPIKEAKTSRKQIVEFIINN